jgi:rare lipoprotein A (peptidoglycan hydrolase)
MKRRKLIVILSIWTLIFIGFPVGAQAETDKLFLTLGQETITKGYTAEFNNHDFKVAFNAGAALEPITVEMKKFNGAELPQPEGLKLVSDNYIYDIIRVDKTNKSPMLFGRSLVLAIRFNSDNYFRKKIYYYDGNKHNWFPLNSSADYQGRYVRAFAHLPFSHVAVFEDQTELEGVASWYRSSKYKYGAATNNYPQGTKLRVRNVDNNKTVDVEVVSTGPFGAGRVIDLTLPAFQQLEESWKGLVRVQVTPIDDGVKVLGADTVQPQPVSNSVSEPRPQSKAVVAIKLSEDERIKDIVYSKNYDTVLPLASLTKLMTAAVFLETQTPLDKIVTYSSEDNAIGSKLYVSPGETMTTKDLFFTMLVGSANNAANALARSTGLSREEFVQKMNAKAEQWGLEHTHFVDVSGLDPANVSTVYEVALMAKQVLNNFQVFQATMSQSYGFSTINTSQPHVIKNTAPEMFENPLRLTGMKTGYLDEADYCLMVKARKNGEGVEKDVIAVVMGAATPKQRTQEINDLLNYAVNSL